MRKRRFLWANIALALLILMNHPTASATELTDLNSGSTTIASGTTAAVNNIDVHNSNSITNNGSISVTGENGYLINDASITGTGTITISDLGQVYNDGNGIINAPVIVNDYGSVIVYGGTVDSVTSEGYVALDGGTINTLTAAGGAIGTDRPGASGMIGTFSGSAALYTTTDITNNIGFRLTINNVSSPSTMYVVAYSDSSLATAVANATSSKTITNTGYQMLSGNLSGLTIVPQTTDYSAACSATPLISSTGYFTGYSIGASTNTVASASSGLRQGQLVQVSMNHLRKRLGELRNDGAGENGIWARTYGGEISTNKYGKNDSSYNGIQVGYDKKQESSSGRKYTGGAISYTTSKDTFATGDGNSYDTDFALYQTWVRNDGHYTDLILKHGWLQSKYSMTDTWGDYSTADYRTQSDSISAEYGYRKQLNSNWYIEPQAELTYAHINGVSYTTGGYWNMNVNQDGIDRLIGRTGIGVGRKLSNGNHIYTSLSALHEFEGDEHITADNFNYDETMGGTWGEFIVGVDAKLSDHSTGYMNVEKLFGGDVSSNWQYNAGCRFTF